MPKRIVPLSIVLALIAFGCADEVDSAATAPTSPPVAVTSSVSERPAALTATPPDDETALVNWSETGVVVRSVGGELRTVTTAPGTAAVLFGDGTVVYQPGQELIVVVGEDLDREIRGGPDRQLQLLDGRDVNGLRHILVTSAVAMPVGPDDAEQRLLLFDIDTGVRYDLGRIGGWESTVFTGRFTVNAIALMRTIEASFELVLLDHDGVLRDTTYVGSDGFFNLTALSPGDDIAVFKGSEVTLVDAWTGKDRAMIAGEWPCRGDVWAGPTRFYCSGPDGPFRVALATQSITPIDWAPTGMVAPAVPMVTAEQHSRLGAPQLADGVRQIGLSPDGRFRYVVDEGERFPPRPILVDDGSGPRPAMADPRDQYRRSPWQPDSLQLEFIDETTVIWSAAATGSATSRFIGRIDERGMIRDITFPPADLTDYEVFAVTTSGRDLEIDDTRPLIELMEEYDQPLDGGWFVGNTLAEKGGCGAKTLYRTTADGYGRVLAAGVEFDEPVAVQGTELLYGLNVDSVSTSRVLAIAVRCPDSYEGVRVHLVVETIGYGDNGPRNGPSTWPLLGKPIELADGAASFSAITGIAAVGYDCVYNYRIEIGLETLDGRRVVVEVSQWPADDTPLTPLDRTEVGDPITDTTPCEPVE